MKVIFSMERHDGKVMDMDMVPRIDDDIQFDDDTIGKVDSVVWNIADTVHVVVSCKKKGVRWAQS